MDTRELFWALSRTEIKVFNLLGTIAMAVFFGGVVMHLRRYLAGRPVLGWTRRRFLSRIWQVTGDLVSHSRVRRRDSRAGLAHAGIFVGFLIAFAGTSIIFIDYDIVRPIFGTSFWKGGFYRVFELVLDAGHTLLIFGLLYMLVRRIFLRPEKLEYVRTYRGEEALRPQARWWLAGDWLFLLLLLVIEVTGFLQEGLRLAMEQPASAAWSPAGNLLGTAIAGLSTSGDGQATLRHVNWWFHGVLALTFTAMLPWTKAWHAFSAPLSLLVRDSMALSRLPGQAEPDGLSSTDDLTWKDRLNLDACTKCGRCHEACPARATGYPLSPRDFVQDLRQADHAKQGALLDLGAAGGPVIEPETLWACRMCGACQEVCPVGIEPPPIIVRMRRHLVEQGEVDDGLQQALANVGEKGNSFGEPARRRGDWARELPFRIKDIRKEPADVLWFVGDYAAFDPRSQQVSRIVAGLLVQGGLDFGLLYDGEYTAGNDIRRVGEEGLFSMLAEHNIGQFVGARSFNRILSTDPHTYNTLRNEYPDFGDLPPVEHYTTVLLGLLDSGALRVERPLELRVTFHDPCHLGRLNGGYDAPRELLRRIGCDLVEMPRNRDNSFCCGAGGGRIWMPDAAGQEKPSENRMHEAAAIGPIDVFVVCCPKDLTMYEDARKTSGHEEDFQVKDIAELVAEAVRRETITLDNLPEIIEAIADRVAAKVASAVTSSLPAQIKADHESRTPDGSSPSEQPPVRAPSANAPTPSQGAASELASQETDTPEKGGVPAADESRPREPATLATASWESPRPITPATLDSYDIPANPGLRILVAVKHAAQLGEDYELAPGSRVPDERFLDYVMNEWDDAALEEALQIADQSESIEVVVVTVGGPDAEATLRKALAKGAARAVRVKAEALGAVDALAVARLLAGVAVAEQPDLILTGAQSADAGQAATGTALARVLGLPLACVVTHVDWDGEGAAVLEQELEGGLVHRLRIRTPAVLTIQTGANSPRFATMRMIKQARKKPLAEISGEDDGSGGHSIIELGEPQRGQARMLDGDADMVAAEVAETIRGALGG